MNSAPPVKAHELKCWPDPFDAVKSGQKRHEVRRNDRGFEVGHLLHLRKFDPDTHEYMGPELLAEITYVSNGFGLPDGLVVLSIRLEDDHFVCVGCRKIWHASFGACDDMPGHCDGCWATAHPEEACP